MKRTDRCWKGVAAVCLAMTIPVTAYTRTPAITETRTDTSSYDVVRAIPEPEEPNTPISTTAPLTEPDPEPVPTTPTEAVVQITIPAYAAEMIGRTIWGEAGGVTDPAERAAVAWCILNRVDEWGESIRSVITEPDQFHGYIADGECPREHIDLAADVLERWAAEKAGASDVGRVLPEEYLYFWGDGEENFFRTSWKGNDYWDWSMPSPY